MTEMSRAGVGAGVHPGPPTSSSPPAPGGAEAPDGMTTAPALDAQSEAEVARTARPGSPSSQVILGSASASGPQSEVALAEESGTARPAGYVPGEVPAPPRTYRPLNVDDRDDVRVIPTTWKPVTVKPGVL